MALKQASRLLNLKTPLGDDVLLLTGFSGEEGMSQLFRFELAMNRSIHGSACAKYDQRTTSGPSGSVR